MSQPDPSPLMAAVVECLREGNYHRATAYAVAGIYEELIKFNTNLARPELLKTPLLETR